MTSSQGCCTLYADWLCDDPDVLGYGPWAVVHRAGRLVVGSAGFVGLPARDGSIELGFGIHPDHRRRGYATEASRALVDWGLAQELVTTVTATCDADNLPSMRVLENIGMTRLSDDGRLVTWRIARS